MNPWLRADQDQLAKSVERRIKQYYTVHIGHFLNLFVVCAVQYVKIVFTLFPMFIMSIWMKCFLSRCCMKTIKGPMVSTTVDLLQPSPTGMVRSKLRGRGAMKFTDSFGETENYQNIFLSRNYSWKSSRRCPLGKNEAKMTPLFYRSARIIKAGGQLALKISVSIMASRWTPLACLAIRAIRLTQGIARRAKGVSSWTQKVCFLFHFSSFPSISSSNVFYFFRPKQQWGVASKVSSNEQ